MRWPVISESCQVRDAGSKEDVWEVSEVWEAGEESVEVGGRGAVVEAGGDVEVSVMVVGVVVVGKTVGADEVEGGGGEAILRRAGRDFSDAGGVAGLIVAMSAKLGGGNGEGVREGCTGCRRGAGCGVSWISSTEAADSGSRSSAPLRMGR